MTTTKTLIAVAALACGTAFAAQNTTAENDVTANSRAGAVATDNTAGPKPGGLIDKTKNALHRMGEKTRNALHRANNKDGHDTARNDADTRSRSDTRAMGAAGSDNDSNRRGRMDQAYSDWKSKQK